MMPMINNNPMAMITDALRRGMTPQGIMQQMAMQNPQARMAMQMMQGKSNAELEQIVRNMARERGVTIEDVARSMGVQIPSGR